MTTIELGKFTTAESADNGIILRHPLGDGGKEFFVGLPAEEALLALLVERKEAREAELAVQVVRDSIDNLKGETFDSTVAWDFIDLAAANLSKANARSASFDGLLDALVTEDGKNSYRLAVTDLEEIREIVQKNTF